MTLEVTQEAVDVLTRTIELANLGGSKEAGVRLRAARALGGGIDVQVELAEGPTGSERVIDRDDVRIFVDDSVLEAFPDAIVAVEPQHETIVVRPRA